MYVEIFVIFIVVLPVFFNHYNNKYAIVRRITFQHEIILKRDAVKELNGTSTENYALFF